MPRGRLCPPLHTAHRVMIFSPYLSLATGRHHAAVGGVRFRYASSVLTSRASGVLHELGVPCVARVASHSTPAEAAAETWAIPPAPANFARVRNRRRVSPLVRTEGLTRRSVVPTAGLRSPMQTPATSGLSGGGCCASAVCSTAGYCCTTPGGGCWWACCCCCCCCC